MLNDLLGIFFPKLCIGCNNALLNNEEFICTHCYFNLPVTQYHLQKENPLEKTFSGRVKVEQAFSFLFFRKGNITQYLLHELKYKGNKELGKHLGKIYAEKINGAIDTIDAVAAIPLHKSKLRKRGYNQSYFFAEGLSEFLKIENVSNAVSRNMNTDTQTKKSRYERWENVENIFSVTNISAIKNKHILLVDDVITTGATIEACANEIIKSANCRVSVASIAIAVN